MLRHEAPFWAQTLPQLPRLIHRALSEDRLGALQLALERIAQQDARRNRLLAALVAAVVLGVLLLAFG